MSVTVVEYQPTARLSLTFTMPGTKKPRDPFHLSPRWETVFLSPEGEGTPPTPPQPCPTPLELFWPVLPQPLLLQPCTFQLCSSREGGRKF